MFDMRYARGRGNQQVKKCNRKGMLKWERTSTQNAGVPLEIIDV